MLLVALMAALVTQPAAAESVPANLQGTWSSNCQDPAAARMVLGPGGVSLVANGHRLDYAGVSVSRTWIGGAKATGDRIWLLTSRQPGQPFEFIVTAALGSQDFLVLEEGHPELGRDVRSLFGLEFRRCGQVDGQDRASLAAAPSLSDGDGHLDVAVIEQGGDGQMANCSSSMVAGLKAGGDDFLAVRSGPGTQFRKIGELRNGEVVIVFEQRGDWAGVVYRTANVSCGATRTQPVTYPNRGWIHSNWLKHVAG